MQRKPRAGRSPTTPGRCRTATPASVLGDFADAKLNHFGVVTTFSRTGDKFMVRTDGPDGALRDYEIAYTFGVYPLQQYLIALPGGASGAQHRVGQPPEGAGRPALAPSLSRPELPPAIGCTGPGPTKPGTICAPTATQPT